MMHKKNDRPHKKAARVAVQLALSTTYHEAADVVDADAATIGGMRGEMCHRIRKSTQC
jgi:hypothetical protein